MTLITGSKRRIRDAGGFTLIELVLVMAILIAVLSMTGTSLTSFFKGRTLEAEGKRFLALTRHAQNQAVSEGIPMSLWIDPAQKKYGLEPAASFAETDDELLEFELGKDLEIQVTWPQSTIGAAVRPRNNEIVLQFNPEGFIDETNPELIVIKEKDGEAVNLVPALNRLNYEITTNKVYAVRR
jgi:type II secretory pathway pseudopilin PulG